MDTTRHLHLIAADDLAAWPDLARALERSGDALAAAEALRALHARGHVVEAAQWLARVTDAPDLQGLRGALRALAEGWQAGPLRALAQDLLSGAFRLIPAGAFLMGSPEDEEECDEDETQHDVTLTRPYLLKATPVTQAEWLALMSDNPSRFQGDERRPVERVSWEDAVRFCDTLSARTGGTYRLPTEAEWEYACRAGTTTARYADLDLIAWSLSNADRSTQPVGQRQPNPWGLHDMLGNVKEWCQDWYDAYPDAPQRDPTGPLSGSARALRGGAWLSIAELCRAAQRFFAAPTSQLFSSGFRPASALAGLRDASARCI